MEYNIEDFGSIEICYNINNPDAVVTAELLFRIWSGMVDISKVRVMMTAYSLDERVKSNARLVVCLGLRPPEKVEHQLLCVSSDISVIRMIEHSLFNIRDLDKYKKCSIVYTPYSIAHFCLNYMKQCILQDIKGINYMPFLDNDQYKIDLKSYDDDVASVIGIENPHLDKQPLLPLVASMYIAQAWNTKDLDFVSSYTANQLKGKDIRVIVRVKGVHYLINCKDMVLMKLSDVEGLSEDERKRISLFM